MLYPGTAAMELTPKLNVDTSVLKEIPPCKELTPVKKYVLKELTPSELLMLLRPKLRYVEIFSIPGLAAILLMLGPKKLEILE